MRRVLRSGDGMGDMVNVRLCEWLCEGGRECGLEIVVVRW